MISAKCPVDELPILNEKTWNSTAQFKNTVDLEDYSNYNLVIIMTAHQREMPIFRSSVRARRAPLISANRILFISDAAMEAGTERID